ncbi:hypothetical protein [Cohnella luojiensis]|uniref:Uncharacterized protein n=1 Tax=Cohnella luojiensis TaxID=652876 RepID=A0A4Y8M3M1_9BACL|nr:hypothetical protein [Cohnella luojiensis]TFE28640.1 hypothetical protein E2980_07375 [Cohnella luojiensis]
MEKGAVVKLENFSFSGLDASQLGAIKSVADYYQIPLTSYKIYGMTGLAFLFILDEGMVQPNAGPPEPEIFRLTRNLGDTEGLISLHWADQISVKDEIAAFREALDFVIRLNEEGT